MGDVQKRQQRLKPRLYDESVVREANQTVGATELQLWQRLVAIMPELVAKLECLQDRRNVAGT